MIAKLTIDERQTALVSLLLMGAIGLIMAFSGAGQCAWR
jgi:hypothetical protein